MLFAIVRRVDDNVTTQPIDGDPLIYLNLTANSKEDEYDDRNDFAATVHRVFRNMILRSLQYRALLFQKGAVARLSDTCGERRKLGRCLSGRVHRGRLPLAGFRERQEHLIIRIMLIKRILLAFAIPDEV